MTTYEPKHLKRWTMPEHYFGVAKLEDYPVVNEDHLSNLEFDEACENWERMSTSERLDVCKRCDVSIFAARRNELPHDDNGSIMEYLRG